MKGNAKVIHFHIKGRAVQGLIFVQITFEKYTTNFYFQNSQIGIKMKIANLQPFLISNVFAYLHILIQPRFQ